MSSGKRYYVASPFKFRQGRRSPGPRWRPTGSTWPGSPTSSASTGACRPSRSTTRRPSTRSTPATASAATRRSGSWVTYGLGTENQRPAGVRRPARAVLPAGRAGQLGQRLPAGRLPGHPVPRRGVADPRPGAARRHHPRAPAGQPRPARPAQPAPPGRRLRGRPRRPGRPGRQLRARLSGCRRPCRACSTSAARTRGRWSFTGSATRRPTPSAASACWPAGWSSGASGSSSSTTAPGTATTTSPAPTPG